ncbi:MAG: GrpB family protein [Anaerolinea sp.]|nr:GrpB family protein [Anaerolinea sp.]
MEKNTPPIVIEPYQPEWQKKFSREAFLIRFVIGRYITKIEHIGSTAVPGLAAKPIIDMLIGVNSLTDTQRFVHRLERLGYVYVQKYEVDLPERRYLYKQRRGEDTFHLHMVEPQSEFFRRHIAFRDYLRSHPDAVTEYASLKLRLAREFGSDRAGYTDAKTEFIQSIEHKAKQSEI